MFAKEKLQNKVNLYQKRDAYLKEGTHNYQANSNL